MSKNVQHIPDELLDDIRDGGCVPVVGAGLSLNALLPKGCQMPLWNDLGSRAAKKMKCKSTGNALKDLSRYCDHNTKSDLLKFLWEALYIRTARPGRVHMEFAKLPFKHVITTNFDFLLDKAFYSTDKSFLPVLDEDQMNSVHANVDTRLVKMHGDFNHPSLMVVTEEEYDGFRDQREPMFREVAHLLSHNTVLFVGYSIEDPDFRQIWELVKSQLKKLTRPAYTLLVGADDQTIKEYERRGVTTVISLPGSGEEYGTILTRMFQLIGRELGKRRDRASDVHLHRRKP